MHSIIDVAKYIFEQYSPMTTMKLQKLTYYCQACALVWDEEPLFTEDFEAWANGPVCPKLYQEHRGHFKLEKDFFASRASAKFTDNEKETIDTVLKSYANKSPQWLSDLTHLERPWKDARTGLRSGESSNNIISKEKMQLYYGGL